MNVKKLQDSIQLKNQKYIPFPSSRKPSYFQDKLAKEQQASSTSLADFNASSSDMKPKNYMNNTMNSDYDLEMRKSSTNHFQGSFKGTSAGTRDLRGSIKQSDLIRGGLAEFRNSHARQSARAHDLTGSLKKISAPTPNQSQKNFETSKGSSTKDLESKLSTASILAQFSAPESTRSPRHGKTEAKLNKQEKSEVLSERRDFNNSEEKKNYSNSIARIRTQDLLKQDGVVSKLDFNLDSNAFKRHKGNNEINKQIPDTPNDQETIPASHQGKIARSAAEESSDKAFADTQNASRNVEPQRRSPSEVKALTESSATEELPQQILRQTLCSHLIDNFKLKPSNIQNVEVFSVRGGVSELKTNKPVGSVAKNESAGGKYEFPGGKTVSKTIKLEKSIISSEKPGDQTVALAAPKQRAMSDKKSDISERKYFENSTSSFNALKESQTLTSTSRLEISINPNIYYSNQNQSADKKGTVQDFIYSIKDFSNGFSTYFKKKLKTFTDRLGCSCDANLKNKETCSRAHTWLSWKYNSSEFEDLRKVYDSLKEVKPDEKSKIQIKKDINRTFPTHEFFKEKSDG